MSDPYKITNRELREIKDHCRDKIKACFPDGLPVDKELRFNRELEALKTSPYTYALLVAYDVIKGLRYHRFRSFVDGKWACSYIAWFLGLTEDDPIYLSKCYREMGIEMIEFVRDECYISPIEIFVTSELGEAACLKLLDICAHNREFWIYEFKKGQYKLINAYYRKDDLYANRAPIIQITKS